MDSDNSNQAQPWLAEKEAFAQGEAIESRGKSVAGEWQDWRPAPCPQWHTNGDTEYRVVDPGHRIIIESRDGGKPLSDMTPEQLAHLSLGTFQAFCVTIGRRPDDQSAPIMFQHRESGAFCWMPGIITVMEALEVARCMSECIEERGAEPSSKNPECPNCGPKALIIVKAYISLWEAQSFDPHPDREDVKPYSTDWSGGVEKHLFALACPACLEVVEGTQWCE